MKKEGVLLLDSFLFKIVPLTLSKGGDERERELEIEEILEEEIDEYDRFYYIDKEITIFEDREIEKILIIMIEKDKVYSLIENLKDKKLRLLGIYPLFFMEFFNFDNMDKNYLEISDEKTRIYTYSKNKLVNFVELDMENEEIISNPQYLDEYLEERESFVYPNQKKMSEYLNLKIRDWKEYNLKVRKELDYLPKEYAKELIFQKFLKLIIIIVSIICIIGSIFFFSFQYFIEKNHKKLEVLQREYQEIKEKNLDVRENIKRLEEEILKTREENREREFNRIKISQILREIVVGNQGIDIFKIDYDGERNINIVGESVSEDGIYSFQRKLKAKGFKNMNQDYIKLEEGRYKFCVDVEVDYEGN